MAVFPAADASPVPVAFDEAEGHQNKKQKLSDSVATTTAKGTTTKGTGANTGDDGGNGKTLSTEDEAMMQQIRQITQGGYIEGLEALIVGRSIPTNLVDWISIKTIAEEILYNNEDDDVDENPHMNRQQTKKKKNKNKEDEIWENVLVIPTTEEKIQCCAHRYFTAK